MKLSKRRRKKKTASTVQKNLWLRGSNVRTQMIKDQTAIRRRLIKSKKLNKRVIGNKIKELPSCIDKTCDNQFPRHVTDQDLAVSDSNMPISDASDSYMPDSDASDSTMPDLDVSDSNMPDSDALDSNTSNSDVSDSIMPNSDASDSKMPDSDASDSSMPDPDI